MNLSVAVVTSSRGRNLIAETAYSVERQTYKARHYVFAHGQDCWDAVQKNTADFDTTNILLPNNNGGNGYGMAPVFALAPFVVNEDIIFYLDDDNWFEPDHIESLVTIIQDHDLGWAYSLRKIVDNDGNWICDDNCESLGCHPNSHNMYLVDNSCYAVRTQIARLHGHTWHVPIISDRSFQQALMRAKIKAGTTGRHTANYRLSVDGSGGMSKDQFINNNEWMRLNRPSFEWTKKQIFNF
jgi:hypothetical protein